jgi:probable DNA metabolism protein
MRMQRIALQGGADYSGFRHAVRALIAHGTAPDRVVWDAGGTSSLFEAVDLREGTPVLLPRRVLSMTKLVVCHRDPEKYALLYTLIWRLLRGEPHLLEVHSDALVQDLEIKCKAIRRDLHKMHAFLRFRRTEDDDGAERFVAWFEPDHFILDESAEFFVDRFRSLIWSILTPIGSLHWDRSNLSSGPPARREDAPGDDVFEGSWNAYYQSTFNPARVNTELMRAHMPKKYWRNLPETHTIDGLVQTAQARVQEMCDREAAMPRKKNPSKAVEAMKAAEPTSLTALNAIISASEPLVPGATRAVLGEGPVNAPIALVGEQPGDVEDQQGRPFVGPAGQLLNRALLEAGIDRESSYLTNAVKHFKFEQRGKRRIHQKPTVGEVKHYRWWLAKELELVKPRLIVALGATAVLALKGSAAPVMRSRGPADFGARRGFITVHPSYLLRLQNDDERERAFEDFVTDLKSARAMATA